MIQDPQTRRYKVDARAFALGSRFVNRSPLTQAALPLMRALTERSGHSTRLSIRVGEDVLYLVGIEGPHFVDTGWRAGQWMPLHATSAARIFLAAMPPEAVDRLLDTHGMPALTPDTIQDRAALRAMLGDVRRLGFARNRDETARGLATLSVPVYGLQGSLIAAITLAFPSHVVETGDEPGLVEMLHQTARIVSQKMGGEVYPYGNRDIRSQPP